ncbi:MAG: hypothetical protein AAGA54_35940 [Myxococcota bacterium]
MSPVVVGPVSVLTPASSVELLVEVEPPLSPSPAVVLVEDPAPALGSQPELDDPAVLAPVDAEVAVDVDVELEVLLPLTSPEEPASAPVAL